MATTSATLTNRHHCCAIVQPHPHAGATYKILAREDGAFEVEVCLPMTKTHVTITDLLSKADAERWIAASA